MRRIFVLAALLYYAGTRGVLLAGEYYIAFAKSGNIAQYSDAVEGFKSALEKKRISFKLVECNVESGLADVSGKPDLFLAVGSRAKDVMQSKVKDVPIIFSMIINQSSIGTNMTGVSLNISPIVEFKLLKRILPESKKVGVLYDPGKTKALVDKGIAQARELGMEIVAVQVSSLRDVYSAVRSMDKTIDALWMIPDSTVYTAESTEDVLLYSLREKIPVIGISDNYVKAGALFSISCDYKDIGMQTGYMALKILKGENPADITVAEPEKNVISLNLITAERIGIILPDELIREAENVYR